MREATLASAPTPAPLLIARTLVVAVVLYFIAQKLNDRRRRARAVATPSRAPVDRATTYSREDVAKHAARDDLWVIIDGKVYDLTEYVDEHPGGADAIARNAGGDATTGFNGPQHPSRVFDIVDDYLIGALKSRSRRRRVVVVVPLAALGTPRLIDVTLAAIASFADARVDERPTRASSNERARTRALDAMRAMVARPARATTTTTTTRRARADKMKSAPMTTTTRAHVVARAMPARARAGDGARCAVVATRDAGRGDGVKARAASSEDEGKDASDGGESGDSELTQGMIDAMQARRARKMAKQESKGPAGLEDVNPVNLGRKSRAAVENVFKQLTSLTSFQKSTAPTNAREFDQVYDADLLSGSSVGEFETPNAKFTTVLVTGATGRIGRVLIRKLLLRGYTVKALVRRQEDVEKLPGLVQVIVGDVGEKEVIKNAMIGVNKVIYCASAKTSVTSDLYNVADQGVKNVVSCMQDYYHMLASRRAGRSAKSKVMLTNFKHPTAYEAWDVEEIEADAGAGADGRWAAAAEMQRVNFDPLYPEDEDKPFEFATFNGFITSRTGKAEVSSNVEGLQADVDFSAKEGLLFRLKGDGKRYSVMLTQDDGSKFRFSFNTTGGWQVIRMPFHKFVSEGKTSWGDDGDAILDLKRIEKIGVRFDARKNQHETTMSDVMSGNNNMFNLTLEYVKAIPKGEEPDVILVSCFGAGLEEGEEKERILKIKRDGERVLRNSGVGYTIVRPGELVEEAGGGKALVFDQTERINTPISCADVSDVCVKAMHDEEARNKSFDVGYEYESEQAEYELITQVKGKSDNYLTPALKVLEKNS